MMGLLLNLSLSYQSLELRDQILDIELPSSKLKALSSEQAEVVKLANTLCSGRSERKLLRVQLPPSAILENQDPKFWDKENI